MDIFNQWLAYDKNRRIVLHSGDSEIENPTKNDIAKALKGLLYLLESEEIA
jgi:hypothetical protein